MKARHLLTLAAVVALGMRLSAQAPAAPALTAWDYVEIGQLVQKYARAIDTCSNNGYDYADLFCRRGRAGEVLGAHVA